MAAASPFLPENPRNQRDIFSEATGFVVERFELEGRDRQVTSWMRTRRTSLRSGPWSTSQLAHGTLMRPALRWETLQTFAQQSVVRAQVQHIAWQAKVQQRKPGTEQGQKPAEKDLQNERLTYKTIGGGPRAAAWTIRWVLTRKTKSGGWIVQHIQADFQAGGRYDYWEAWPVPPNSQFTEYHLQHFPFDDEFTGPAGSTIHASARFYEGLKLPPAFVRQPAGFPAGILRATKVNPHLPAKDATAPDVRTWIAH